MAEIPDEGDALDAAIASTLPVPVAVEAMDNFDLVKLAREVAMNLRELPVTLAIYKISEAQYELIAKIPFFKRALDQFTIEWNGALSTHERIKVEAAIALEDGMPTLAARMSRNDEDLAKAVEAGKLFAKLAGIGEEKSNSLPGEKFTITINLGDDAKLKFEKDVTPTAPGSQSAEISAIAERENNRSPIPKNSRKKRSNPSLAAITQEN